MKHDYIDRYARLESPIHSLDPRAKAIALIALIVVCVITPPEAWWSFCIYAGMVIVMAVASRLPVRYLLTRTLVVVPFILLVAVFVPFMHRGGVEYHLGGLTVSRAGLLTLWNVTIKSIISVLCLIILASTTPFPDLMHGFERLHVPKFFTTVTAFMYRYVFLIIDVAERMKRARDSRNFRGRWLWHARVVGYMIASLFLRSHERAERVYQAMCARGFDGTFPRFSELKMRPADYVFVALVVLTAVSARLVVVWT